MSHGGHAIRTRAEARHDQLVAWRRHLHAYPELAFEEKGTSAYVAQCLEEMGGWRVRTGVAGYGVVADLGSDAPRVLLRADMDALPVSEENPVEYRSRVPGLMHACGHDGHVAMGLGAAALLRELHQEGTLPGAVRIIFQPAEEAADPSGKSGAVHMVEAGVLEDVRLALALHLNPEAPLGVIQLWNGYAMANVDVFRGVLSAAGGHAGYPELGADPLWMLGTVLQALHAIVSRRVSPLDSAVVSVGRVDGGTAPNVLATTVRIEGTLRSYLPEVRDLLETEVDRAFSLVRQLGGDYELAISREESALKNDARVNRFLAGAVEGLYPEAEVRWRPFGMGGEDFAYIAGSVPAAMAFVGCGPQAGERPRLHSPRFTMDERVLPMGAAILVEAALAAIRHEEG
jgi:amidohydrolase